MDVSAAAVAQSDDNVASQDAQDENGAVADDEVTTAADADGASTGGAIADGADAAPESEGTAGGAVASVDVPTASAPVETAPLPYKDVPGGRAYEIIYIVRAGDPDGLDQTNQRVRDLIEGTGGAIDNIRVSEARRVAYPIKKQLEGNYVVVNARFVKETNRELDRFFKLEESVLRHMVLAEDTK